MQAVELERLAEELGLDVVGAARAEPYEETERHIRERRARGLFADMRFTMAQPEVSCHPETLLEDARTVVSAALCYWEPGAEPGPGEGRLPRYTWTDKYAELRTRLLADIRKNEPKKGGGPAISLDEDLLRHVNLTPGTGNPGLLKNDGRIAWPLALQSDDYRSERELLNSLAPEAIRQAVNGRVDPGALKDMNNALAKLRDKLTANINDVTPNNYIEASRFLGYFGDALKILARPDAGDFFSSRFASKGMTVEDLMKYMSDKGLTFAPAVTGDESAYQALHRALVAYDLGSRAQYTAEK